MRWPEPRPPLVVQRPVAPGEAQLWADPFVPGAQLWALGADAAVFALHQGAFELTMTACLASFGCNRLLELRLRTWSKAREVLADFAWRAPATDRDAVRALGRLGRQRWWRLAVVGPDGIAAVEMANTLELPGLVRSAFAGDHRCEARR